MLALYNESLWPHFLRVNVNCILLSHWYNYCCNMDNILTSLAIKNPGLRHLPPGVERYFVQGGGLSIIEISAEDKIEIINDEGKQTCEVIVFDSQAKWNLSILN